MDGTVSLHGKSETLLLLQKIERKCNEREATPVVSAQGSIAERIATIAEHVDKSYPIRNHHDVNAANHHRKHWTDFLL
jgi:hypothetical protein